MTGKSNYDLYYFDLSSPPDGGFVSISGARGAINFVEALKGGGFEPTAKVEVSLGEGDHEWIPLRVYGFVRTLFTHKVRVRWEAQAGVTVQLLVADPTNFEYEGISSAAAALIINGRGQPVPVQGVAAGVLDEFGATIPATTNAQVMPANPDRVRAVVQNGGTGVVRLRGDNGTGAGGLVLEPGETVTLHTSAVVRAYNPNGFDVYLRGVEEVAS